MSEGGHIAESPNTSADPCLQAEEPDQVPEPKTVTVNGFEWSTYLKETGGVPAPAECFYQSPEPIVNLFEPNKKLTVSDLRGGDLDCLGSVQVVHAAWIKVRLEGTDTSDDRWVLCDDVGIKALPDDMGALCPPVGYLPNVRTHRKWLEQQLTSREGEDIAAKKEWFKPIDDKYHPKKNFFQIGHKLEAVDTKNFSGSAHVATVVKMQSTKLTIHFDGWPKRYDIVEMFNSRNLFPVGWCARNGLEVQVPALTLLRKDDTIPKYVPPSTPGNRPTPASTPNSGSRGTPVSRLSEGGKGATLVNVGSNIRKPPPRPAARTLPAAVEKKATPISGANTVAQMRKRILDIHKQEATDDLPPVKRPSTSSQSTSSAKILTKSEAPQTCSSPLASLIAEPSKSSHQITAPAQRPAPMQQQTNHTYQNPAPLRPSTDNSAALSRVPLAPVQQQHQVPRLPTGTTPAPNAQPLVHNNGTPTDVMLSCGDSVPASQRSMTVFVNRNCTCGPLLNPEKISQLPRVYGPLSIHHVVREVVQQMINSGTEQVAVYRKVEAGPVKILSVTAQVNGFTNVRYIPIVKNVSAAWSYIRKLMVKIGCCPNLFQDCASPCNLCPSSPEEVEDTVGSTTEGGRVPQRPPLATPTPTPTAPSDGVSEADASIDIPAPTSKLPLSQWTIERVCEELSKTFEPSVVEKFQQNQIDGRALILLKTELLMQHLGMPFGPALKVMNFVESIKK